MKDCKGQDCAAVDGQHSVACLYEYALARLGLTDTPEMRVLFWDAKDALQWDEETDRYITPAPIGQHDSDCSTNNRGVPELLGPCDCSLSQAKQHVVELPTMSMALGSLPADQRETAANVLLMCKQAVLDSGAAVKMGAWTEGDAAVAELVQEAMQDVAGGKTYTHEEAKQLMAERRAKVEASKPTCTDERPCVNCFSGQGECEVKQEADDLTQFLEQTDFDAAEKVASSTVDNQQALPAGEDDCEGCKI